MSSTFLTGTVQPTALQGLDRDPRVVTQWRSAARWA